MYVVTAHDSFGSSSVITVTHNLDTALEKMLSAENYGYSFRDLLTAYVHLGSYDDDVVYTRLDHEFENENPPQDHPSRLCIQKQGQEWLIAYSATEHLKHRLIEISKRLGLSVTG